MSKLSFVDALRLYTKMATVGVGLAGGKPERIWRGLRVNQIFCVAVKNSLVTYSLVFLLKLLLSLLFGLKLTSGCDSLDRVICFWERLYTEAKTTRICRSCYEQFQYRKICFLDEKSYFFLHVSDLSLFCLFAVIRILNTVRGLQRNKTSNPLYHLLD
jgi:hypothetical protein